MSTKFLLKSLELQLSYDFVTSVLSVFVLATYGAPTLHPNTFVVIEPLHNLWKNSYDDIFIDLVPAWDNLISKLPEVFVTNNKLVACFVEMVQKKLGGEESDSVDRGYASEMINIALLNCKGKINNLLEPFLFLVLQKFATNDNDLKIVLLKTILYAFYYDVQITTQILMKTSNTLEFVLTFLIQNVNEYKKLAEQKLIVLALSSLLQLPLDKIPPVSSKLKEIVGCCALLIEKIETAEDNSLKTEDQNKDSKSDNNTNETDISNNDQGIFSF